MSETSQKYNRIRITTTTQQPNKTMNIVSSDKRVSSSTVHTSQARGSGQSTRPIEKIVIQSISKPLYLTSELFIKETVLWIPKYRIKMK